MTWEHMVILIIPAAMVRVFVWGRRRYCPAAVLGLIIVTVTDLSKANVLFAGFGRPAVVTAGTVLIISQGLLRSGVVNSLTRLSSGVGVSIPTVGDPHDAGGALFGIHQQGGALDLFLSIALRPAKQSGNPHPHF